MAWIDGTSGPALLLSAGAETVTVTPSGAEFEGFRSASERKIARSSRSHLSDPRRFSDAPRPLASLARLGRGSVLALHGALGRIWRPPYHGKGGWRAETGVDNQRHVRQSLA